MSDTRVLSQMIEASVAERGLSPQSVWMDKEGGLAKGVRRCDAIFRAIDRKVPFTLLDAGCGPGLAIPYLRETFGAACVDYHGVDVSEALIKAARAAWPGHQFSVRDIVADPLPEFSYDHVVLNGVITAKFSLSHEEMEAFAASLLASAWRTARLSLSFNVMSSHVDWTRDDLFHWPMDSAAAFCVKHLSRHFNILADYGLYEYTVQVLRDPRASSAVPRDWQRPISGS
jgi:SAM-dependent methyltransferase